jgi:hypothetical protein
MYSVRNTKEMTGYKEAITITLKKATTFDLSLKSECHVRACLARCFVAVVRGKLICVRNDEPTHNNNSFVLANE